MEEEIRKRKYLERENQLLRESVSQLQQRMDKLERESNSSKEAMTKIFQLGMNQLQGELIQLRKSVSMGQREGGKIDGELYPT